MKQNKIVNEGGVNGTGKGIVNINSKDYKALQAAIQEHAQQQTPLEKMQYALISLKFQMDTYVSEPQPKRVKEAGEFLKDHLNAVGVKRKIFAQFIDIEESNLSAIIKGRRKVNIDFAFKLGQVFGLNPNIWLLIQSKNELLKLDNERKLDYKKYKLEDLLKKAS